MPLILKPSQIKRVQKMIPNCCNWDEGICLLLEMPCPQQLSSTAGISGKQYYLPTKSSTNPL